MTGFAVLFGIRASAASLQSRDGRTLSVKMLIRAGTAPHDDVQLAGLPLMANDGMASKRIGNEVGGTPMSCR